MKHLIYIVIILLFACNSEEVQKSNSINYTQDLLKKYDLNMDLPTLEYGEYFWENDSINYVNVFILNDSTIRLGDSIFNIGKLYDTIFDNTIRIYNNYSPLSNEIEQITKQSFRKTNINIFMNQLDSMQILTSLYQFLSTSYLSKLIHFNLIGKDNYSVSIKHYNNSGCRSNPGMIERNILEISINKNNDIMIEGEWDMTFDSIFKQLKLWYLRRNENSPYLNTMNKRIILQNIKIIKEAINDTTKNNYSSERLNKNLNKWNYYLKVHSIIGDFEKINKYSSIVIQYDKSIQYKNYIEVVDYCHKGLISLKDEFCINKIGITYTSLSPLDSTQNELKKAIDFVYPNIIMSIFSFPPPPPYKVRIKH